VIAGFEWQPWLASGPGARLRDDRAAVSEATADDLAKLLTAIIRSDRFVEGSLAGAFESGLLAAIASRARVLAAELETVDTNEVRDPRS
jgi:Family of unknown function (DUF6508)